ncbi:DMT family transporter [Marivibrio halodurans]|uniref:DMT family transporter n=1 Tax=Marivibrio halodurans TaxID=2039722 RepID=A0A8J7V4I2_9PROT|nr:DMT family transporter [Marivibrio halodurans]
MSGRTPPGLSDYALLVALAAIWGGSFLLIKLAVETIPPVSIAAGRTVVAAAVLLVATLATGRSLPRGGRVWALILAVAVIGNVMPFTLIAWGEERVDSGLAAIVMGINPLVTLALAHCLTADEKAGPGKIAGMLLGLAGVVVLIGPGKLLMLGDETLRYLAFAVAASCYASGSLINKKLSGESFRGVSAGVMMVSAAILVPASLIHDRPWTIDPTMEAGVALLLLGLLPTALANLMLLTIIRRQGAAFFSQINYLVPLFGLTYGVALLGEAPPVEAFAALALILSGIAFARGGKPRPPAERA